MNRNIRILLIDEDTSGRAALELLLKKSGYPIFGSWVLPQYVRNRYFCHS